MAKILKFRSNNIEALKAWVKENGAWNNSHTIFTCINCIKSFQRSPSAKAKFCSKICYYQDMKQRRGEITSHWKGGISDNNKCVDCQKQISYASKRCKKCAVKLMPHMYIKNRPWLRTPEAIKKALKRRLPSSLEAKFQNIIDKYNLPYKFVGNGEFLIERKNPDFININGEKKAVEVYARRHKEKLRNVSIEEWKKKRQELFAKYGWEIFFFNEVELNDEKNVLTVLEGGDCHS